MALKESIKRNWIEIQKKHPVPVNAIGLRIDESDTMTLRVWHEEGIDAFIKR